jgi:succinate dehydrogenase hydrophobic anchor subunit
MRKVFERPRITYVVLVVAIVGFFALSAVGNTGDHNTNVTWIGNIGWAMFLLSILVTILYTVALAIRAVRRRSTA